jgi:hypothetical protein
MKPAPRQKMPMSTGTTTPKRSASRPMTMPPSPKPIMVSVYGSDASERPTSNSACTGGSATVTMYMPAPPSVISASDAASLSHA